MENKNNDRCIELCKRVVTTESFIEEAKAVYGEKYDYSKVVYKNRENKVVVCCPVHGDFEVYAREHLDGKGCPKCAKGEKFVAKLRENFGDKFGLDNFIYESSTQPVELICPIHGSFFGLTNTILYSKCGCPECGKDLQRQIQEEAKKEAEAKKEQEQKEKYGYRDEWLEQWNDYRDDAISRSYDSLYAYSGLIDSYIEIIKRGSKWQFQMLGWEPLPYDVTSQFEDYNEEYTYYLFKGEAACQRLIDKAKRQFDYDLNDFCKWLSRRDCKVSFLGDDLLIREGFVWEEWKRLTQQAKKKEKELVLDSLPKSFVGIDFETLYPQRVSACSVGMVKYKNGEIVDRYYTLIRPPFDYPGKKGQVLTWIHGIKEDDVRNERTFAEILPELEAFAEGLPLAAHFACVERSCINDTTSFYNLETSLDFENIIDTYAMSLAIEKSMGIEIKGEGTHSLDAVCRRFGVPEMRHHNALDDAEMCGNLLLAFESVLDKQNVELQETTKTPAKKTEKYNAEDKVQRTDLENVAENPFKDCAVVLTGFAVALSQEYGHRLKELGAKVCTGVSYKTQWLICGPNAGPSKMEKAKAVGAQIIGEEEFLSLIQNIE